MCWRGKVTYGGGSSHGTYFRALQQQWINTEPSTCHAAATSVRSMAWNVTPDVRHVAFCPLLRQTVQCLMLSESRCGVFVHLDTMKFSRSESALQIAVNRNTDRHQRKQESTPWYKSHFTLEQAYIACQVTFAPLCILNYAIIWHNYKILTPITEQWGTETFPFQAGSFSYRSFNLKCSRIQNLTTV